MKTKKPINAQREIRITQASIALTTLCLGGIFYTLAKYAREAYLCGNTAMIFATIAFGISILIVSYSNYLYQICLIGYYKRRQAHMVASDEELNRWYGRTAPALCVLVPSYKEECSVIRQTLLSAALSEYPQKNVVLLIDDPYRGGTLEDMVKLEDARRMPKALQALFDAPCGHYREELESFNARLQDAAFDLESERRRVASHYTGAANWLENLVDEYAQGRKLDAMPIAERFFIEAILQAPLQKHRATAATLHAASEEEIRLHYMRLIGLFNVNFSSFERKKYANLSHEANKAMNLNSYIGIIGKSWREEEIAGALHLKECSAENADFTIPDAAYVNTIDADSLMLHDYLLRVVNLMEQPENHRIAVTQSTCSSTPAPVGGLEHAAAAGLDVQFKTHQGYTHWHATFWVGANAMLRKTALDEIREERAENGHLVSIYIQDRTVIEDTESTIDLVEKGWKLHNYPERMTYSATPPDFGSLLIQRRRWSNGGLIILPKLLKYAAKAPKTPALFKEMFMRFHYLASTTTSCLVGLMFFFYPFGNTLDNPWLPFSAVPFLALYARDLKNTGYRYSDAFRICALNLMLFPIIVGGVCKQFQQMVTGKKIPFGRTPKVPGRTAAPVLYSLIALALPFVFLMASVRHAEQFRFSQAGFALLNTGILTYALVNFIGVKAALEDSFAWLTSRLRKLRRAEILPMPNTAQDNSVFSTSQAQAV